MLADLLSTSLPFLAADDAWSRWLRIVLIDLMLAGDNAVVIALAVRSLPPEQQRVARLWGTAGAVGLRLLFIVIVSWLLSVPLLQLVGGLVLIWIAVKLLRPNAAEHGTAVSEGSIRSSNSLGQAVRIIILADVTMSLDNVLAIAATAQGDLVLVVFGIALTIPLIVWGSGLLATLMNRFVWIIWLGGGVLGLAAGELILHDRTVQQLLGPNAEHPLMRALPWALAITLTGYGWWWRRRALAAVDAAAS